MQFSLKLGTSAYGVDLPWPGNRLRGPHDSAIAFDTETEVVEGQTIPRLALWTASANNRTCVGRPDQLVDFLIAHASQHFVLQNAAFDVWVCDQYLRTMCKGEWAEKARNALWTMIDEGRMHDTMLLDQLLRLAEGRIDHRGKDEDDARVVARNLAVLGHEYCGFVIDKTDPFRKRFVELIGRDLLDPTIDRGFFEYAARDTLVTHAVWKVLVKRAREMMKRARKAYPRQIDPDVETKWGLLTESLQLRATVALADISRRGFAVDKEAAAIAEAQQRVALEAHTRMMHTLRPQLFKYTTDPKKPDAPGQQYFPGFAPEPRAEDIALSPKSGAPKFKTKKLVEHLESLAAYIGFRAPKSLGKKGGTSKSAKEWSPHVERDIWLGAWVEHVKVATGLKFFNLFKGDGPAVHTRFNPLLLTGRTSASKPSVQQCCDGVTELLTDRGWVRFDAISEDDAPAQVAQFDPEGRTISFVEPEQWVAQRWSKPLVHLSNSNVDFCVTHDHRCLVETRKGELEVREARDVEGDVAILHAGHYAGGEGNSDLDGPFLLFLIAMQADGTWDDQGRPAFHLKRDDKITKLKACLDALGAKATGKRNPNSGSIHIVVLDEELARRTHELLGPDKLWGPWLLTASREALDFFTEEVWAWDGDKERGTGYTSEHEHNAGWVQIVCALSGRRAQVRKYVNNGGRTAYVVDHSADEASSYITHAEVEAVKSPGTVYCVTVESGFIVTRRDGKVTITGNCPRDSDFRKLFVPRPGFELLTMDFAAIELRTLAATCEADFGASKLGDVIRRGIDPHEHTAALLLGQAPEAFRLTKATQPKEYKEKRQRAKACNFGVPGGLGPLKLAAYARQSYDVDMSIDEAAALRYVLIHDVYPELDLYLTDDSIRNLQWTLGVGAAVVAKAFHIDDPRDPDEVSRTMKAVGKVLRGRPQKADGTPYKKGYIEQVWLGLAYLVKKSNRVSAADRERIEKKLPSPALEARLLGGPSITLTGRIRANASYTQARNTKFQGLAADGMKLAIWRLCRDGYRVVNMIHDEVVVELPEAEAEAQAQAIERILCESMQEVIGHRLPIEVEYVIAKCWAKA